MSLRGPTMASSACSTIRASCSSRSHLPRSSHSQLQHRSRRSLSSTLRARSPAAAYALAESHEPLDDYPPHHDDSPSSSRSPPSSSTSPSHRHPNPTTPSSAQAYLSDLLDLPPNSQFPPGLALQALTHKSYRFSHIPKRGPPESFSPPSLGHFRSPTGYRTALPLSITSRPSTLSTSTFDPRPASMYAASGSTSSSSTSHLSGSSSSSGLSTGDGSGSGSGSMAGGSDLPGESWSAPHNSRLAFLGRRAIHLYITMFLHSVLLRTGMSLGDLDFLRGSSLTQRVEDLTHVKNVGSSIGTSWGVDSIMRWDRNPVSWMFLLCVDN